MSGADPIAGLPEIAAPAEAPASAGDHGRPAPKFRLEERDWLRRRLSILFADLLTWTVGLLPWPLRFWLADRVGDLWYRLAPTYRANVRANLSQVFGGETPERRLDELVRGVFRQNARNFTDLFRMPHWDGADFTRLVAVDDGGWALLDAARARGKGIVLVTAHLGAFDVVGQAIGARGHPMTALTGRTTARFIFDAVTHLRRGHNVVTVEATPGGVRKVVQALRRNELAGLVSDYDFFQNGLPVTLFGRETTMPPGPVRFARDTGASVVGAFARRAEKGYAIAFSGPFEVPKTRDLEADMAAGMANLAAMIEEAIASVPEQWVILQRVWPTVRPEPVRVFPVGSPRESELLKQVDELLPKQV